MLNLIIPPRPERTTYRAPASTDHAQTVGQLRARMLVRIAIAQQDIEAGDTLAHARNMAEADRLEDLIAGRAW
jgi:hypothetical protein